MTSTKKQLVTGVLYTGMSKYAGIVVSLVVAGILGRLLTPSDFGVVAVATVIITFFGIFSDLGIAPAIVQHRNLDEGDLSRIFSFTVWSGITISALFFMSSWAIADFYDKPILVGICQLLSLNLLFATFNIVPNALLTKAKRFRFIAMRSIAVQVVCGAVAVTVALLGGGIYALLINPIFSSIVLFGINYRQYPQRAMFTLGLGSVRKIFAYSVYQLLFNIINYFSRNLDKLLIGRYMGMTPLGYYEKSYRLMMLPLQNVTHVVSPVMHPIFVDFQDDMHRLSDSYLKVVRFLAFVGFPLSVFLFFSAREVTLIAFGPQWQESVAVFRILSLSVGIQVILSTSGSIFQAANSTRILFLSGLLSSVLNAAGIAIGIFVFHSLEAVAWGICITFSINFVQCYLLMYRVTFRVPMAAFWKQLTSPLAAGGIMAIVLYLVSGLIPADVPLLPSLMIKGGVFIVGLGTYIQLTGEYDIKSKIISLIKR